MTHFTCFIYCCSLQVYGSLDSKTTGATFIDPRTPLKFDHCSVHAILILSLNVHVVLQLVPAESSASDTQSQCTDSQAGDVVPLPAERVGGIGDSRPPSFQ